MNDRTPIDQFDVTGSFDFAEALAPLSDLRQTALDTRPDLKAAVQSIDQARSAYKLAKANASTDPTISIDGGRLPQSSGGTYGYSYAGLSINIPLRIFDRNQGEILRTNLDITRNERLLNATEAQLYGDVDSAHATIVSTVALLKPYKAQYLKQALAVRDTVTFSYERGGASLLDFLSGNERLPGSADGLSQPGRLLFIGRSPNEHGGGPGGYGMKRGFCLVFLCFAVSPLLAACGSKVQADLEAPPAPNVKLSPTPPSSR